MLEDAKRLALEGVAVHWLHKNEKRPIGDDWQVTPVASVRELEATYRPGNNVGARMGKYSDLGDGKYLYCYDVDIKGDDQDCLEAYAALKKILPGWESFPHVESGRRNGSIHVYFACEKDMPSRKIIHSEEKVDWINGKGETKKSWAWEIELFGTRKQVAIPPSIHPDTGKKYVWGREIDFDNLDDITLKASEIAKTDAKAGESERKEKANSLSDANNRKPMDISKKEARKILEGLPDDWAFDYDLWLKVGMALHHQSEGADWGLKMWHWFSEIDGKYDQDKGAKELDLRWRGFLNGDFGGRKPVRFATLMKYSERDSKDDDGDESETAEKAVERLNQTHALIRNSGKVLVLNEERDGRLTWSRDRDFMNWFHDDRIDVWGPPDKKGKSKLVSVSVGKIWWNSKLKRKFEGITMLPEGDTGELYNLWRGWSVKPDEFASCELLLDHIFENVCNSDQKLYDWFMAWLAQMVQDPQEKPGVAVALRGRRGVGKTIIGDILERLMIHHCIKVAHAKHLTGAFNAHLGNALLVRVEEAFWVGDRAGDKVLRDLITAPTVRIEQKGVDSTEIPSFHRFLFTSNEAWVVPAGMDERRFALLDVKDYHRQDRAYFKAILRELRDGGYGALLHHLKTLDISKIDVGVPPVTAALADQKLASLTGIEAWWAECVHDGRPPASKIFFAEDEGTWDDGPITLPTHEVREDYEKWLKQRKYQGDPITAPLFTKRLLELCPPICSVRPRDKGERVYALTLPPLSECRVEFDKHFGQPVFALLNKTA